MGTKFKEILLLIITPIWETSRGLEKSEFFETFFENPETEKQI